MSLVIHPEHSNSSLDSDQDAGFYREVLDTLRSGVAVLDAQGTIVHVNKGWHGFAGGAADLSGPSPLGLNFFDQDCLCCSSLEKEKTASTLAGIRDVLDGRRSVYMQEYPCTTPEGRRWHVLRVSAFQDGRPGAVIAHLDITERKAAEEASRASEQRLQTVIGNMREGLVLARTNGQLIHWNPAALEIHGFSNSDEWCRSLADFTSMFQLQTLEGEHLAYEQWPMPRLFRGEIFQNLELRLSRLDIPWSRILRYNGATVRQASGEEIVFLTISDITDRALAEEALENSQRFLLNVIEHSGSVIFVKDLEGRYELVNQRWEEVSGMSRVLGLGRTDAEIFPGLDAAEFQRSDREIMSTGRSQTLEEQVHTPAGIRSFLCVKFPMHDASGAVSGVCGMAAEITERHQAEERLREQAALLDKAQDAILVRDLDHRITFWNKSAERLYGWAAEQAVGRSAEELLYGNPITFLRATETTLARGEWVGEIEQVTRHGRTLVVEGHWTLVRDEAGQPKSILAINTDLTARKKLEEQFLRAQRMESIGTLAGGIAHDLNNVLSPILMSLELLQLRSSDPAMQDLISIISTSAQRGADMVRQVLSFARGVEGQRLEVQLRHLVRDLEKIINETFLKSVKVRTSVPHDLWTVSGDATQLHQVLLNLCVNARDAMPHGGELTISTENLLLDLNYAGMEEQALPGPYVAVQVEDTGCGMPPAVQEKIFDPFFTTKPVGQGTGLGLSTTMAIVKSHGGFIRVYSEVGRGTRFKVYLPASSTETPQGSEVSSAELPRGSGEWILVVDDEASVRQITQQTLEAFGYRALVAGDGAEALALFASRQTEIAALLTDMMMPIMDGVALIQVIRKLNPKLPVLAASGLAANANLARASSLGIRHFLPKPYTAGVLLKTLREALEEAKAV